VDTNYLDGHYLACLAALASHQEIAFQVVTVTERERGLDVKGMFAAHGLSVDVVPGLTVLGEWRLGEDALPREGTPERLEETLAIISGGSFPPRGKRGDLTPGQRRQHRDAIVLASHVDREGDVLLTRDRKTFINNGRRERLETLWSTRIVTLGELVDEFSA
jgi:hypothetical protein